MPSSSFYTDGETYDTAVVVSNDNPATTTPSQAPSSFYPSGNVYTQSNPELADNYATQAAASAAAALASQNAAHTSETNAASSAATSSTQASASASSASAASTSATSAATSDTNAASSASTAATQASAASTSASNASSSATTASTQASAASTSASNAASSETNAAASASAAHTSETNAASSAASAATSATNAASAVQAAAGTATPLVDGTAAVGTGTKWAHEDHVHPTDTSRADAAATTAALALKAPLASPALTGNPTAPTQTVGDNSTRLATTAFVTAEISGSAVSSLNGQTGALVLTVPPLGRLTLASGVPVISTSQAGKTVVYYALYAGNIVPIYDGTNMVLTVFTELSQATTDTTKSPAAVAANSIYDMFIWNDSGTLRCTRGPAWTNATTRGYTMTMINGILLNTASITNGPAALRGTWVGTIASNASGTIDYIFGGGASGGLAGVFGVWNTYNRVSVGCTVVDLGPAYTYSSTTFRQARGSTAMQVSFVVGASEDSISAVYQNVNQMVAASSAVARIGIGYDSVTVPSNNNAIQGVAASTLIISPNVPYTVNAPSPGAHYFAALENSDGTNANTFNLGGAVSTSGLAVSLRM